ncbi:MAG: aminoacetone oxidase family FAD-binding enzyme [Bacteroidales bacterium]|nr:aminoacetone oxidase family FAD-binding enzyme [Bacteroidales bacterium]
MKISVIGAGAAGCFCAANLLAMLREKGFEADVELLEKASRPLVKLGRTGGGRCNLTNTFEALGWPQEGGRPLAGGRAMPGRRELSAVYPRGNALMSKLLGRFGPAETIEWFESRGVRLKVEDGGRVFPVSDDAREIVHCLGKALDGASIRTNTAVESIDGLGADFIVLTTGGGPGMRILNSLGIETVSPVPSLFAFRLEDAALRTLAGIGVKASLSIPGTSFKSDGSLLVTDFGISGPAVLRLSSYAARHLAECGYKSALAVNWLGCNEEKALALLEGLKRDNSRKLVSNAHPGSIPSRLWACLCAKAGIAPERTWGEVGVTGLNKLRAVLCNDSLQIAGRSPFKDEFVTSGGVAAGEVDPHTLECKKIPGLYFAGEILDIDALTGGFNLQAAWSTAYAVAAAIAGSISSR